MGNSFAVTIGVLCLAAALFIILRNFMLWYWKVNKIVEKLDLAVTELKRIAAQGSKEG